MESWKPVFNENGMVMMNGENLVLQNVNTKEVGYLENNENNRRMLALPILSYEIPDNIEMSEPSQSDEESSYVDTSNSNKVKWTHGLTKLLITKRLGKERDFNRPKCKKIKLWSDIAKEINAEKKTVSLTAENCDNKYRNLLKTYKANKKKQKSSGESAIIWEYFTDFDEILGCKASTEPPQNTLFDTMETVDETNSSRQEYGETNDSASEMDTVVIDSGSEASGPSNKSRGTGSSNKKKTLKFNEYLYIKNKREEEKENRKEFFYQKKWEEEKQLRKEETNAILKLAEALAKKD